MSDAGTLQSTPQDPSEGRSEERETPRDATLRSQLVRALLPAVVLAVLAGSAVGTVTLVNLTANVEATALTDATDGSGSDGVDGAGEASSGVDGEALDGAPSPTEAEAHSGADATEEDELPLTFEEAVRKYGAPDYATILTRRYPGAQWSLSGNDPDRLVWIGPGSAPTRAELDAHWPAVAAELARERVEQEAAEAAAAAARAAELEARRNDPNVTALLDRFDPRTIWGSTPDYAHILTRRFPGAQWSLNGNDPVGGLTWIGPGTKPTKAQLDALWAQVAREMALEMDPKELERWAGTGEQIYVDGVLRPKGWVGGANDPQPEPLKVTEDNWRYLPQLPSDGGGGSIDIYKDPTGAKNFEQLYSTSLEALVRAISQAHGNWGNQYGGLGLGMNGDRTLIWYSSRVDRAIVVDILTSMGARPADRSAPAPTPTPDPDPDPAPDAGPTAEETVEETAEEDEAEGAESSDDAEEIDASGE